MTANPTALRISSRVLIGLVATVAFVGCARAPRQTQFMESVDNVDMSTRELRIRVYGFGNRCVVAMEHAADVISEQSTDPAIQRNALLWKMNAVPVVMLTAFQPDPLAALIDLTALCFQMTAFFESGSGSDLFGDWQHIALDASRLLQDDVLEVARSSTVSGDISEHRVELEEWARDNPIEGLSFARKTVSTHWAEIFAQDSPEGLGSVVGMAETMDEMMERLTIYGGVLPRQARWEAELVVADLLYAERMTDFFAEVESIEGEIDKLEENFDQITTLFLDAPELVEAEREVIMQAIDDQVTAVLAKIDAERVAVTNDLRREREVALRQIEAMSLRLLDASSTTVDDAIDHFYRRAAVLLGVLVILGVAAGVVTLRLTRNVGRPAVDRPQ